MRQPKFIRAVLLVGLTLFLMPCCMVLAEDVAGSSQVSVEPAQTPKTELDKLKAEWEEVREQQIQMIREKEDQLEKLKEEIFAKAKEMNAASAPIASGVPQPVSPALIMPVDANSVAAVTEFPGGDDSKTALQAERQKFFKEMTRQKESLRQQQAALEAKAKQLEAERQKFESEKAASAT